LEKNRVIQEYVPGKQVTLAHVIAHPDKDICRKLGLNLETTQAIGILTITPGEAAIIGADVATKAGNIEIGFLDRFSGTLVINGNVSSVETSIKSVLNFLENTLKFSICDCTRS
jgi:ethanolamine utilization protein EutS